ncbi:MAG TPA: type II toxin-antitoxin system HicB family antitoxin [Chloroflexia bacterium]|nr:type II toxin-antitoxin system HicB family antitoxin [Chloroflexia bacterium]
MNEQDEYDHYSMLLEWDPVDRIYVVTIPELPGCHTHGKTYEEAARHGQEVIEGWIDASREWGQPVPKANYFVLEEDFHEAEVPAEAS